jgi:hypothetical protein
VITYDSREVLKHFSDRMSIPFPMLSDSGSKVIRSFGILNESVKADTPFYGVPHPGTYIVDRSGRVKSKYFEEDYRDRFTAAGILVREFSAPGEAAVEHRTPHVTLTTRVSNATVYGGSRLALIADLALPPRMHVYAPGVGKPYIPIDWSLAESPAWVAYEARYPKARKLRLEAIQETVPVYEGKVRLIREVKIAQLREAQKFARDGKLVVEGSFRYQACDDRVCYAPQTIPSRWELTLENYDKQRAPADLRGPSGVN